MHFTISAHDTSSSEPASAELLEAEIQHTIRLLVLLRSGMIKTLPLLSQPILFQYRICEIALLTLQWRTSTVRFRLVNLKPFMLLTRVIEQLYLALFPYLAPSGVDVPLLPLKAGRGVSEEVGPFLAFTLSCLHLVSLVEDDFDGVVRVPTELLVASSQKLEFLWRTLNPLLIVEVADRAMTFDDMKDHVRFCKDLALTSTLIYDNMISATTCEDRVEDRVGNHGKDRKGKDRKDRENKKVVTFEAPQSTLERLTKHYMFPPVSKEFNGAMIRRGMKKRWKETERDPSWKEYHPVLGIV